MKSWTLIKLKNVENQMKYLRKYDENGHESQDKKDVAGPRELSQKI